MSFPKYTLEEFEGCLKTSLDVWKNSSNITELNQQLATLTDYYVYVDFPEVPRPMFNHKVLSRYEYVARQLTIKIVELEAHENSIA